jgi:Uma2 family endonuclease
VRDDCGDGARAREATLILGWRARANARAGRRRPTPLRWITMRAIVDLSGEPRRRLMRSEYEQLVDAGSFEGERVELIQGEILEMSPTGPDHDSTVDRLNELLVLRLTGRARVRTQGSIAIGDHSEPVPDLLVLERRDYDDAHPSTALLAIEVARSSLRRDRGAKAALYAEAGIPEYWVVNLVDRIVEVHTEIISGSYARVTPYRKGDAIRLVAFADVEVAVDTFLR